MFRRLNYRVVNDEPIARQTPSLSRDSRPNLTHCNESDAAFQEAKLFFRFFSGKFLVWRYSIRLLNIYPAAKSASAATIVKGTKQAPIVSADALRKNKPFMIDISQRTGLTTVAVCNQLGILSIGVANPERIIAGGMNRNTPNVDCCCVVEAELIISPTLTIDAR